MCNACSLQSDENSPQLMTSGARCLTLRATPTAHANASASTCASARKSGPRLPSGRLFRTKGLNEEGYRFRRNELGIALWSAKREAELARPMSAVLTRSQGVDIKPNRGTIPAVGFSFFYASSSAMISHRFQSKANMHREAGFWIYAQFQSHPFVR